MSKQANPTLVGSFVILAIVIAVTATLLLGNIRFTSTSIPCIIYFDGSLHNLDIGAPVTFRGVQIGTVSNIQISFDGSQASYTIPVYIDIDPAKAHPEAEDIPFAGITSDTYLQELIAKGLRAKLKIRTLVTGKLYIDLDFFPDTPLLLRSSNHDLVEIPSLPSDLEQLSRALENLPLSDMLTQVSSILNAVERLVSNDQLPELITTLNQTLADTDRLALNIEEQLPDLVTGINEAVASYGVVADNAARLVASTEKQLGPALEQAGKLFAEGTVALASAAQTLEAIRQTAGPHSPLAGRLNTTLEELNQTARSVRQLSEFLLRNPDSVLFGRREPGP